jgi:mannose-6-phosphate isomerase-like protein (cupin superfamily)
MDAADRNVDLFVFMDRSEHWVVVRGIAEVTIGAAV